MSQKEKLLDRLRRNPKNVRPEELEQVLNWGRSGQADKWRK